MSAELTSKYGFSVVAPTSTTRPSSTAGSSASCWALLKRWISSRKKIVRRPARRRSLARSITARTSGRPTCTAESSSKAASAYSASSRANVVLPVPGGPWRIIECGSPDWIAVRSADDGPSRCCWPTNSSSVRGRIRAAHGRSAAGAAGGGSSGASNSVPIAISMRVVSPVPLATVAREWGRIGLLGFGGPPAHVALLRDLTVARRRWIDAREVEDAFAVCSLLPGPASTQMASYTAQRVGGRGGALVGGLAFILPGLAVILVIAAG